MTEKEVLLYKTLDYYIDELNDAKRQKDDYETICQEKIDHRKRMNFMSKHKTERIRTQHNQFQDIINRNTKGRRKAECKKFLEYVISAGKFITLNLIQQYINSKEINRDVAKKYANHVIFAYNHLPGVTSINRN